MNLQKTNEKYRVSPLLNTIPTYLVPTILGYIRKNFDIDIPPGFSSHIPGKLVQMINEKKKLLEYTGSNNVGMLVDAVFRKKIYWMPAGHLDLLHRIRFEAGALQEIVETRPELVHRFLEHKLLLPAARVFNIHGFSRIEIEINRHCNYRCKYCPVHTRPNPPAYMSAETYHLILERAKEYNVPSISLNHYSEPTLDPHLTEKIHLAGQMGLKVDLNTNASLLDKEKIKEIAQIGNTNLLVNLPSVDKETYKRVTGSNLFDKVMENLRLLHEYGIPTRLSINTPRESDKLEVCKINAALAHKFGEFASWPTDNRAGSLNNSEYALPVTNHGLLSGCFLNFYQLNVNWEGKPFLCCQDHHQDYILGDLHRQSINEIAESPQFTRLRKWIFGGEVPPRDFICTRCDWTKSQEEGDRILTLGRNTKFLQYNTVQGDYLEMLSKFPLVGLE